MSRCFLPLALFAASCLGCSPSTPPASGPNATQQQGKPETKFTHVIAKETEYYITGPQQGRPPDGKFKAGTKVGLIEKAGSYSLVESENAVKAYVATESVTELK